MRILKRIDRIELIIIDYYLTVELYIVGANIMCWLN